MKHIIGQESKPGKRRGRALQCASLSKHTFCTSVQHSWRKAKSSVVDRHTPTVGIKRKFAASMRVFRIGRGMRRKKRTVVGSRKSINRPTRGYDMYISTHFQAGPDGTLSHKRSVIARRWKRLSAVEQGYYQGLADRENQKREENRSESFAARATSDQHLNRARADTSERRQGL